MYPVVKVSGSPYERGLQYGRQARERVRASLAGYDSAFAYYAGWTWAEATAAARLFVPAIEDYAPALLEELAGIAAGAGVADDEILAVNVRTEIMYSARIKSALGAAPALPTECSALASGAPGRRVLVGQNWDWVPFANDTVVVLRSEPDDGPPFVTVVEAGLLAKFGVNAEGLAVMTNALSCTDDDGDPGVPYHVVLRELLSCDSTAQALGRLDDAGRASSANYLLADRGGAIVDVEARPGGPERLHRLEPDDRGVLVHTNHFVSPDFDAVDYATMVPTTSRFRHGQVSDALAGAASVDDAATFEAAMRDHTDYPDSVCRHADPELPPPERTDTVASIIVDLADETIWLASGHPCEAPYEAVPWP